MVTIRTCKNSSSKVSQFKKYSGNERTDRRTNTTDFITIPANAVYNNNTGTFVCLRPVYIAANWQVHSSPVHGDQNVEIIERSSKRGYRIN